MSLVVITRIQTTAGLRGRDPFFERDFLQCRRRNGSRWFRGGRFGLRVGHGIPIETWFRIPENRTLMLGENVGGGISA